MNVSESLASAENSIRNLIVYILTKAYGESWPENCGISEERISKWREKQETESKRLSRSDPRLIYYSDFYDLLPIIKKNWNNGIKDVFLDQTKITIYLSILDKFRNPDAHRRTLMPNEQHLILGITGEIRTIITRYFSLMESGESYYSRIELAQDNLGNTLHAGENKIKFTENKLRPGDILQFKVSASDPLDEEIIYGLSVNSYPVHKEWNSTGDFEFEIKEIHVAKQMFITLAVKSTRKFNATTETWLGKVDDIAKFGYEILPPRC